jgi:hypothetical protein
MTKEDKIFEVASRYAQGDLNGTQFDWWLCQFNITDDEFHAVYRKRTNQQIVELLKELWIFSCFSLAVIATL